MSPRDCLVLLAKPPVPGLVKTRLITPDGLTAVDAADLYGAMVGDLVARLGHSPEWETVVCHPRRAPVATLAELVPTELLWPEPPEALGAADMGELMARLVTARRALGAEAVILVAGDCPRLAKPTVAAAFAALGAAELVLGPDRGGGCYLIGLGGSPDILTAACGLGPVVWSRGTDAAALRERAGALGLKLVELPPEEDIDHPADVARLQQDWLMGRLNVADMPLTVACLERITIATGSRSCS